MTSNKAHKILEEMLGVSQSETAPTGIQGILQTRDYLTFKILSDTGEEIHSFVGPKLANRCLPGDHVLWDGERCQLELRDEHPPIVGTIELTNKSKYGLTSRGVPIYLFTPYNKCYPHFIVGCSEKDVSKNRIGIVKLDDWSTSSTFPRGLLQQTLGVSGDFEAEKEALIWQASPWKYPKHPYEPVLKRRVGSKDLKGVTINIDPPGCKDIDDVLSFLKTKDGWIVTITISDVAAYIEDGSAVDIMASLIGQTLYDENGRVLRPMLPAEYSEKACSLLQGEMRFGISLEFLWTGKEITNLRWFESWFRNHKSYTYEEFQDDCVTHVKEPLKAVASYLAKEPVWDSHKWVEQMMIFYNTEAGKILKQMGVGILRKHSAPDLERLTVYTTHIPDLQMLAFTSAKYCLAEEAETRHFGLETDTYAHASSPIRRYADLVNQRVLKLYIQKSKERYIVPQTMYDMNVREKAIKAFSRDLAYLIALQENSEFKGIILGKTVKDGLTKVKIYIPQWKRTVSVRFRPVEGDANKVLSRDELTEIDVTDFREVSVRCAMNTNARNWKERVVLNIC